MGVLSLVVWGLSIPAAATCQLMLPAISSPTVATGIYWWLIFVTGEVGWDATWMPIDLPLEGSCFHLSAIYLPDYSNVRQSRAMGSQAHSVPRNGQGRGTQEGMGILSSLILQLEKRPLHFPCVYAF